MDSISILLVEDSTLDAALTLNRLIKEGFVYTVDRVETKLDFEAAIASKQYDVILSDYSLPAFSGAAALEIARVECPDIPFIFVSGHLGEQVAIDTLKEGATDYVLKNRLERLGPAVRRALAERRERDERQRAVAALRESERRYRMLTEAMPQFVWTVDAQGRAQYWNRHFCEYTGLTEEQTHGEGWLEALHPDDRDAAKERWRIAASSGESYQIEQRFRNASDNAYCWHLGRVVPVRDETGEVVQWMGTAVDIDQQKQAEEGLLRSNEELQQFAFAASHDLQEPLRTVVSYTQLLAKRFQNQLDGEAIEYIGFAVDAAKRMSNLIQDLLAYTQVTRLDQIALQPTPTQELLQAALFDLRTTIQESGAVITHDPLPTVMADAAQLTQVFQNLIGNAIKYRRPEELARIHVGVSQEEDNWLISVKDNGQGFEQQYATKIFTIFKRLHSRDVPGTGIGLAICKRVVERHGGRIWAESEPGQGATFHFTLPGMESALANSAAG